MYEESCTIFWCGLSRRWHQRRIIAWQLVPCIWSATIRFVSFISLSWPLVGGLLQHNKASGVCLSYFQVQYLALTKQWLYSLRAEHVQKSNRQSKPVELQSVMLGFGFSENREALFYLVQDDQPYFGRLKINK